jgi:uncharacterized membrane protein (DUF4010 family)
MKPTETSSGVSAQAGGLNALPAPGPGLLFNNTELPRIRATHARPEFAGYWRKRQQAERGEVKAGNNPFELDEAIKFGMLFGVVVLIAKAAQVYLGDAGLYLAAGIAGLTDVDAITLAMADLAKTDLSSVGTAARAIVIAVMANTLVKSGMSIGLGSPELRRITLPISGLLLLVGIAGALLA